MVVMDRSADSKPDFGPEIRELEKRIREFRSEMIQKVCERLRDPNLSEVERVKWEWGLKRLRQHLPPDSDEQT